MGNLETFNKREYVESQCQCEKPKTNADRIRNMSDEELAKFLTLFEVCSVCEYSENERCTLDNPCVKEFAMAMSLKWLQAEVKEGAE